MTDAQTRVAAYVKSRSGMSGLDPDEVHTVNVRPGPYDPDILTLTDLRSLLAAAAEADTLRQRVAALEDALGDAIEAHWCVATSGGTEGKWCVNHDTPMETDTECHWMGSLRSCLTGTSTPEPDR